MTTHPLPLGNIVGEYNPLSSVPQSLLILSYFTGRRDMPLLEQSIIVDREWADVILKVQEKYPDTKIEFVVGDEAYNEPIGKFIIKVVNRPELIEAFREIYQEDEHGSADILLWMENPIYRLYRELTNTLPEEYEPEGEVIPVEELYEFFYSK